MKVPLPAEADCKFHDRLLHKFHHGHLALWSFYLCGCGGGTFKLLPLFFLQELNKNFQKVSVLHASSFVENLIFMIYLAVMAQKMLLKMTSLLQKKLKRLQVAMLLRITLNIQLCMSATLLQRQDLLLLSVSLFNESMSCIRMQIRRLCLWVIPDIYLSCSLLCLWIVF